MKENFVVFLKMNDWGERFKCLLGFLNQTFIFMAVTELHVLRFLLCKTQCLLVHMPVCPSVLTAIATAESLLSGFNTKLLC